MVQRPRTLVTLSLCLLGSLALAACDGGAWESDESQASNAVEVGQSPTFAPNSSPVGDHEGYPPSEPPAEEKPSAGNEPLSSESEEQDEEASSAEEAPAPELQTPPEDEKPAKDEESSPLPPAVDQPRSRSGAGIPAPDSRPS